MRAKTSRASSGKGGGFTLIEMLVVIFILCLLIGMIVGVGKLVYGEAWKQQTRGYMGVIKDATETYYNIKNVYPLQMSNVQIQQKWSGIPCYANQDNATRSEGYTGTHPASPTAWGSNSMNGDWYSIWRIQNLYDQLAAVPQSADRIHDLPREAFYVRDVAYEKCPGHTVVQPDAADPNKFHINTFCDGLGNIMDYQLVGGRPVIISRGPDGSMGDTYSGWDAQFLVDNLRSDTTN